MQWWDRNVGKLARKTDFPFQVSQLYYSRRLVMTGENQAYPAFFEMSVRLDADALFCEDTVNGIQQKVQFPNVAWKLPGKEFVLRSPYPRDTIAVIYPAGMQEKFAQLGLAPPENGHTFRMTFKIEQLIASFRKLIYNLYTPGTVDELDWVCFKLYRELLLEVETSEPIDVTTRIRNISVWFQTHYDEEINMDDVARNFGLSRAKFFRLWKKVFAVSPAQYVINLKLEAAALRLVQTGLPIAAIVEEVNFSGLNAFHKRFFQKYGLTPGEYRKTKNQQFDLLDI